MKNTVSPINIGIARGNRKSMCRRFLLSSTLPMSLALLPHPVLAHNPILGSSTEGSIVLDNFTPSTTIRELNVNVPVGGPTHNCAAIASASIRNPGSNNDRDDEESGVHRYFFGIRLDGSPLDGRTLRTIELRDQEGVNDPDRWPVSTNRTFVVGPGNHTFHFEGGPELNAGESPDITVNRPALTVICSHDTAP